MFVALLAFFERVFAMCLHVSLSVLVLHGLIKQQPIWFWLAVFLHALVDAMAVYVGQTVGSLQTEGLVAVFALLNLWIVLTMRGKFENEGRHVNQNHVTV